MSDLAALKKRRAYIKGNMTKLITFINSINNFTNAEEIKVRLANVERYRIEFNEVEDKIISLKNEEELDADFEDNYYKIVAGLNSALRTKIEPVVSLNDTILETSATGLHVDVKLPKLSIPSFTGNYTEWQSFHDLFCATIHDNPRLTPSQKLQYLKGTLKGEAAGLLKHFRITDANYIEALRKLRERYDRKKHTIYAFIKNFMSQPSVATANSANVRQLVDTSDEILRGLKALGEEAESIDHWLIYIMINKLDSETNNQWAQISAAYGLPMMAYGLPMKQFFDFLNQRIDALDSMKCSNKRSQHYNLAKPCVRSHVVSSIPSRHETQTFSQSQCNQYKSDLQNHVVSSTPSHQEIQLYSLCPEEHHRLFECKKFKSTSIDERRNLIKQQNRCFNCLNDNHSVYMCKSKFRCRQCNRKHHTLLHEDQSNEKHSNVAVTNIRSDEDNKPIHQLCTTTINPLGSSLLPTALVRVADVNKQYHLCRILFDSGSQGSFISEKCAQKLKLKRSSAKLAISGIGAVNNGYTKGAVSLVMIPWNKPKPTLEIEAFVFPKLTAKQSPISEYINVRDVKQYDLADPNFYKASEIDIIIGADTFFELLSDGKITTESELILQNTKLGWIISGKTGHRALNQSIAIKVDNYEDNLDNLLRRFWEIENVQGKNCNLTQEEELCESCFNSTKTKDSSGRLKVALPFKIPPSALGESYKAAVQRMYSIERKFAKDPSFAEMYKSFMREYLTLGHMKEVQTNHTDTQPHYYLPHHGVVKNTSSTTKLRVVFDGSSKTTTGKSLNDCLAVGPNVQSTLYQILFRFRKFKVAITADIEKMYRQIRIADKDTRYQRIIWRKDTTKPFHTYELQTVTYGTSSASYLATRAIVEAANPYTEEFPEAVKRIKEAMYVDDLMTGADTLHEAEKLKSQITYILSNSAFHLRKWLSNEKILSESTEVIETHCLSDLNDSAHNYTKVLGLHWDPFGDCFQFKVSLDKQPTTTKRGILSEASRLFDPLGWLAPVTVTIKIFIQSLWTENLSWDDQLPTNLLNEWITLRSKLNNTENFRLSRFLNTTCDSKIVLHGFSDASKEAYSAVVYGKIINSNCEPVIKLLSAKTKVAPIKQLSIPRLELCGAALLSKLLLSVKEALKCETIEIIAWTDSKIVLDWLNSNPNKWNTFVGNRTGEILANFNRSQWRHVESHDNPADCASRGLAPEKLQHFDLWWNGPSWIMNDEAWPQNISHRSNTVEELNSHSFNVQISTSNVIDNLAKTISNFNKIVRILAYVRRYINLKLNRIPKNSNSSYLSVAEIQKSQLLVIQHIQYKHFKSEIQLIKSSKEIPTSSRIKYFKPFLDACGLLRVGGRITNAAITYDVKHPIILTAHDELSESIIRDHHLRHLHAAPTLMMATLRQRYWILSGRNLIRKVVHSCVKCVRNEGRTMNEVMGQLPNPRVELVRPFYKVGVDYAGPFQTYTTRRRGQKTIKSYICLFVCLATKAVHIELVSDLTSDAYLAALKRFIARRGICNEIHSDNGTNFIGARNHLYQFYKFLKENQNIISNFLLADQINFKLIPPSAPHFGGLWESAVKSIKYHMKRVTNGHILTLEEMTTLIVQIESMLNSRPLCVLAEDDFDYLTPSHFLIGRPSTQLPDHDLTDVKVSNLSRWQQIQQMNQHIWRRWQLEYLTTLQGASKWHKQNRNINISDIVLVKDDNLPPCKWLICKIEQLHPGTDGQTRVVTVKTKNGTMKRPIHKLCLLPVN